MELIIFFTTKDKLGEVGVKFPYSLNEESEKQFYEFKFSNEKLILVVNDNVNDKGISEILKKYNKVSQLYYVYHSLPPNSIKLKLKDFCAKNNISLIPQRDIHEKGKTKYYLLVGKFCSVGAKLETDFFDELKSKFNYNEELEMKLILLHDCLHPESAATTDISWLKPEQKKLVAKLLVINDNLKADYIKTLTQLRKDLLGS